MKQDSESEKIKTKSITATTIITASVEAIVGYIVVWFFEPIWQRLVKWWKNKNESDS